MATKISSNQQHDQIGRGGTTGGGTVQVSSSAAAAAATILNNLSQNRAMRRSGADYYGQQGMASSSQGHSNRQHGNMKAYDVQQTEGDEEEDEDDDEELDEDGKSL